jgi:hypothetical protein
MIVGMSVFLGRGLGMVRGVTAVVCVATGCVGWAAAVGGCAVDPAPRYPAVARALMRRVDQDGDHRLSADEYYKLLLPGGSLEGGDFAALDVDGSGDLDEAELEAGLLRVDPVAVRHAALAAEGAARRAAQEGADAGPAGEPGGPQGSDPNRGSNIQPLPSVSTPVQNTSPEGI